MKRVLALIISISVIILLGVAFGVAALPAAYVPSFDVYSKVVGDYYSIIWVYSQQYLQNNNILGLIVNQAHFFLLCIGSFFALIALIPFRKVKILDIILGVVFIDVGVSTFFVPYFFLRGSAQTDIGLGGGLVAMAVLIIVAGVLEICKAVLLFTDKEEA